MIVIGFLFGALSGISSIIGLQKYLKDKKAKETTEASKNIIEASGK